MAINPIPGSYIPGTFPGMAGSTDWMTNLLELATQNSQQNYGFFKNMVANNTQITDQVVAQQLASAERTAGFGNFAMDRFENTFVPEEDKLISAANSYASPARQALEAGKAESNVAQGMDAQRTAALKDLESFGIDPSSGMYAGLDRASRLASGAASAGAGNQAIFNTEQEGLGLLGEVTQLGEQYPVNAINAFNTSVGADTAAVNSQLANTQEAINALGSPVQWAQIGAGLQPRYGPGGGGGGGGQQNPKSGGGGGPIGSPFGGGGNSGQQPQMPSGPYQIQTGASPPDPSFTEGNTSMLDPSMGGWGTPPGGTDGFNQLTGDYGSNGGANTQSFNPTDTSWGQDFGPTDPGMVSGVDPSNLGSGGLDMGSSIGDFSGGEFAFGGSVGDDEQGQGALPMQADQPQQAIPTSSYRGGNPTTGGPVNPNLSPSGGQQTDDVSARLNAGEFVVPKDIASWKGEEFFHNLIMKSRQARQQLMAQSGAMPQMKSAPMQAPRFQSRPMG